MRSGAGPSTKQKRRRSKAGSAIEVQGTQGAGKFLLAVYANLNENRSCGRMGQLHAPCDFAGKGTLFGGAFYGAWPGFGAGHGPGLGWPGFGGRMVAVRTEKLSLPENSNAIR